MAETPVLRAFEALADHPQRADLATLARALATSAAESRRPRWADTETLKAKAQELGLGEEDAATDFGNAFRALDRGPEDRAERALLAALWGHALALDPAPASKDRAAQDRRAA